MRFCRPLCFAFLLVACAWAQSGQEPAQREQDRTETDRTLYERKQPEPGPARQIGNGVGNIGTGAAKGAGHLALGTARGVGSLATLHPINAVTEVGKGAGSATKDVATGTVKGTAKIGKGMGRAIKHIF